MQTYLVDPLRSKVLRAVGAEARAQIPSDSAVKRATRRSRIPVMTARSRQVKEWRARNPGAVARHKRTYYLKHKEELKAKKKIYRAKTKDRRRIQGIAWKKNNPEKVKASIFKARYGVPFAVFEKMFSDQNGLCAICRIGAAEHTDHNHASGKIRGPLCRKCNWAVGLLEDSPDRARALADYLLKT